MTDLDQIANKIADAIASRPVLPLNVQLWDADRVADYLNMTRRQFLQRIAPLPSFPKAIRIRAADEKTMNPRWKAREVIRWAERQG